MYGPAIPSLSVKAATVSALPQKAAVHPVSAKLNELEDFLKELKTKKKEQLVAGGTGKKD